MVVVAVGKMKSFLSQLIRVTASGQILGVYVMNVKRNKGKEVKMSGHRVICGSCGRVLIEGLEPTIDGICKRCREDYIEDLKKGGEKWEIVRGIPKRVTEACG